MTLTVKVPRRHTHLTDSHSFRRTCSRQQIPGGCIYHTCHQALQQAWQVLLLGGYLQVACWYY